MIKVQIVISGQYMENYGAHEWDGKGECPQYWKFKGAHSEIMACDVPLTSAPDVMKEISERMTEMSWSDVGSSCNFTEIYMVPNKLSRSDLSAFDYQFYDEITSITLDEIRAFLNAFGEETELEENEVFEIY